VRINNKRLFEVIKLKNKAVKCCPFSPKECSKECALHIDPDDLNEVVRNKLASIGVIDRENGICALKNLSLCMDRILYEELSGFLK